MTTSRARFRILAALFARALPENCPSINRGRRESRVPNAPAASRAKVKKHTSVVTTGSPNWSGLPCAMVLTAYSVLSPVTGLFCHRRLQVISRKLDTSVGVPGPHDLAVRAGVARLATPPASIASRPAFRDDREPPLLSRRDVRKVPQFLIFGKRNIFSVGTDNPDQLESAQEIGF
jgi:hypothetical protein